MSERYLTKHILDDLKKKMVFLSGPRQVGKTTLAKHILKEHFNDKNLISYLNWDNDEDRSKIISKDFNKDKIIVFDEIHKYTRWRNYLKGFYDKNEPQTKIFVTGSARLDMYRRGGDSLQGRYFLLRMFPYTVKELGIENSKDFHSLLELSGFPEPLFSASKKEKNRWALSYRTRLFKEDINNLEQIKDMGSMELLSTRLPELVGSPLSYNSLREDLQVSHNSVVRWCDILEKLFYIFRLMPFGSPKIRAVKKEAKHYQMDWSLADSIGAKFENLVAVHLLKWCNYLEDTEGRELELRYFRDSNQREVDFVIIEKRQPLMFIEVKYGSKEISPHLKYLKNKYPKVRAVQLIEKDGVHSFDKNDIELLSVVRFLNELI